MFGRVGTILRLCGLARVSVVAWIGLMAIAIWGSHNEYFGGLFEITQKSGFFWVSLTAVLVCLGLLVAANLAIEHGPERVQPQPTPSGYVVYSPSRVVFGIGLLPALALICYVWAATTIVDLAGSIAAIVLGIVAGFGLCLLAQAVQFLTADLDPGKTPNLLIYPLNEVPVIRWILLLAYINDWTPAGWARRQLNGLARVIRLHAPARGYIYDTDGTPEGARFYPGHIFAAAMGAISFLVWLFVGAIKQKNIGDGTNLMPSLAFALLAIMVLVWVLSALAFFLDRWRIPLLGVLIGWGLLVGSSTETDHYFRLVMDSQHPVAFPTPGTILGRYAKPVLVVTAGGGIQAAAWTTRVIEEIERETSAAAGPGQSLMENLALTSSVSGGSLGSLLIGQELYSLPRQQQSDTQAVTQALCRAAEHALQPSIDQVAWGLANPDLLRALWPIVRDPVVDRGWALERSWEERSHAQEVYLSDWAAAATSYRLPAFIFNATVIETGSPIVMTNTDFPRTDDELVRTRHLRNAQQVLGVDSKLRVSTAARLSATFPYVSPAARGYPSPALHIVDGGYYDNYGMVTGLLWADEALKERGDSHRDIALLEILPGDLPDDSAGEVTGWWYQTTAPIDALLNIRNDDQLRADAALLDLLKDKWKQTGARVCAFHFVYPRKAPSGCDNQPLSWKLTRVQSQCIEDTWQSERANPGSDISKNLQGLKKYLASGGCPDDSLDGDGIP
jgi:hypothetical protein